jgi:hypothetical protein
VLTEAHQGPAVHDLRGDDARAVRRQQRQRLLGEHARLGEVRCGRVGHAVVQQALAQLGAELSQAGGRRGDEHVGIAVVRPQRAGFGGSGDRDLVGPALVVQRERHQLQVGQHPGEGAERVDQQRARRQDRVQEAGGLDGLVHGGVDAPGEQLDARVAGQPGGALHVVVGGIEGGLRRAHQRDRERGP